MASTLVVPSVFAVTITALLLSGCASKGPLPDHETKDYSHIHYHTDDLRAVLFFVTRPLIL